MSGSMDPFWGQFADFQSIVAGQPRLDPNENLIVMHAREDALNAVLEDHGRAPREADLTRRFGNLCGNRATKFRQRVELDRDRACRVRGQRPVPDVVAMRELVGLVRGVVPPAD